jgi:beta-glucosidase
MLNTRSGSYRAFVVLVLTFALSSARAPAQVSSASGQQVDARVDALLSRMSLQEKIGQLTQVGALDLTPEQRKDLGDLLPEDSVSIEDHVRRGEAGSILWTTDPVFISKLQHLAMEETRMKIPLLFGYDVIHGFRTIFPVPLAMAASWDPDLAENAQSVAAQEASAVGINWTFGPMVDIARDARWGRIVEGAGEDPFLGAAMARAQVRGFQGQQLGTPGRVVGSVKHFAGYGAAEGGRDYDGAYISEEHLRNVYLPPFKAAIDAGVGTVMSAYLDLNDVPASGNRFLLRDVLRRDLGFKGFVVSDAMAVRDLQTHGFARDPQEAAFRGMTAGVNMDMASLTYLRNLESLVQSGKLSVAQIDDAVRPILEVKVRMGLFEHPYADSSAAEAILADPEHRRLARVAAQRTMVLLRNENSFLPLKKTLPSVAVIGPLADSEKEIQGSWGIEKAAKAVSVLEGVRAKLPNARVESVRGADLRRKYPSLVDKVFGIKPTVPLPEDQLKSELDEAVDAARRADTVVLVLGELANMSGEAASRASLDLPGNQQQLLEAVVATGKPVVLVLLNGRPLNISWAAERVPAILEAWYPGTEGGNAIADILFGDANPQGRLPVSWPRTTGQVPVYYAHNLTHQPESDKNFTSRYSDVSTSPLYPFGYGLGYTQFAFANLQLSQSTLAPGGSLQVSVDLENIGRGSGTEVVQLYIHQRAGSASRPVRELKGFQRVLLLPSEKKTVRFTVGKDELSFWSPEAKAWVEESEEFDVWAGGDSTASLHASFRVAGK